MNQHFISYLIIFVGVVNLLRMALFLIGSDIYNLLAAKRLKRTKRIRHFPTFSVVIPTRNEEGTIIRAISSVLTNHYLPDRLEVIVVDDGSTDGTAAKVEAFKKKHKNLPIKYIKQANAGKAHALNNGIKNHATGELIMCLDADSYLDSHALYNAARHFIDPKVKALSSNVKIIERPGLLNLTQRYEYMLCYQMKRAESLMNCEYIIGGIGSVFRRSVLDAIDYYDTNTVTEDIDITMKVLVKGNKENKVVYGADVVAHTESVMSVTDLIKQRFRWKWGRFQTFWKNRQMFFSTDPQYTKSLTWFYLPFALFGDLMYLLEPLLLSYIVAMAIVYQDPTALISAWVVISVYLMFNILAENTFSTMTKIKLLFLAPLMYFTFFVLSFVEYIALIKSLFQMHTLRKSLLQNKMSWVRVNRPNEAKKSVSVHAGKVGTVAYAFSLVTCMIVVIGLFAQQQYAQKALEGKIISPISEEKIDKVEPVSNALPTPKQAVKHIVQPGENLWKIAKKYYGDGNNWNKLIVTKQTSKLRPGDIVEVPQK